MPDVFGSCGAPGVGEGEGSIDGLGVFSTTNKAPTLLPVWCEGLGAAEVSTPNTNIAAQTVNAPAPISNVMPFRIAFETALFKPPASGDYTNPPTGPLKRYPHPDPPPQGGREMDGSRPGRRPRR